MITIFLRIKLLDLLLIQKFVRMTKSSKSTRINGQIFEKAENHLNFLTMAPREAENQAAGIRSPKLDQPKGINLLN